MTETVQEIRRVLIVDDDTQCADVLRAMLGRLQLGDVSRCCDGEEASTLLSACSFDLILCDLNMPRLDGVETMRRMADLGVNCPVVLLSGTDPRLLKTAEDLGRSRGLNVVGALHKPFRLQQLQHLLVLARSATGPHSRRPVKLAAVGDLTRAIEEDELLLHYQPQVNLQTGHLESVEALVRWQHPDRGLVFPDAFIPIAEESGLIEPLTDWVAARAIERLARWHQEGLHIGVAINLSVQNLHQLELPDRVHAIARRAQVDPRRVTFEVTESGVTQDARALLDIATRLRLKGFPLSIDDFGTGFSSLTQLRRLPFTELKLDRSFVSVAAHDRDSRSMLESSVQLAQRLDLDTVAEGIESQDDWELLAQLGVTRAQGYHIARPMPGEEIVAWCDNWQSMVA